jgi:hypothetical protein
MRPITRTRRLSGFGRQLGRASTVAGVGAGITIASSDFSERSRPGGDIRACHSWVLLCPQDNISYVNVACSYPGSRLGLEGSRWDNSRDPSPYPGSRRLRALRPIS